MAPPAGKFTILSVDDSEDILDLLEATLGKTYAFRRAIDGRSALRAAFEKPPPDLILLDVDMPGSSGYDVCKAIKASPALADIPVIFLTSRDEARDVVQGFQLGAIDYFTKPINTPVLAARIRAHVELITRRGQQDELIRTRTTQLEQTRLQLIRRLGRAMEYHETSAVGNRVVRLGHYARHLAEASGAKPELCDLIMKAAPLHDIGKLGVPAQVLRKAEKLSAPERAQMQRHPEIGAEIIGEHDDPLLKLARTLALTHHERWDGTGYPSGIAGSDIPWPGRVMAVVDAFEGMTATQFHRDPMPVELAADEIARGAGKQFDPAMVEAFRKSLPAFRKVRDTYSDALGDMLDLDFVTARPNPQPAAVPKAAVVATAQREAAESAALQAMRDADEARAGQLAADQARLKVERDLLAAASKDVSSQQAAQKRAEAAAARESEALGLHRRRVAEETAAAQAAKDRAWTETEAAKVAVEAERAKAEALAKADERLAAERELAAAAAERKKAETALLKTTVELAARDTEALEVASRRVADEADANRMAQERARAEAGALETARQRMHAETEATRSAQDKARADREAADLAAVSELANAQALAKSVERAAAELALAAAAADNVKAEAALLATATALAARDAEALEASNRRLADEAEAARHAEERAARTAESLVSARQRQLNEEEATRLAQSRIAAGEASASPAARTAEQAATPARSRSPVLVALAALVAGAATAAVYYEGAAPAIPASPAPVAVPARMAPVLPDGEPLTLKPDADPSKIPPRGRD